MREDAGQGGSRGVRDVARRAAEGKNFHTYEDRVASDDGSMFFTTSSLPHKWRGSKEQEEDLTRRGCRLLESFRRQRKEAQSQKSAGTP